MGIQASVVEKAADWRWSRLWHRVYGDKEGLLDEGPLTLPSRWRGHVQRGQTETEREALRRSVVRGAPFGESSRQERTAKKLGLLFDAPPSAAARGKHRTTSRNGLAQEGSIVFR